MKVNEIISIMNEIAPPELALSFDHVGLMTGSAENNVSGIMVCLDLDEAVLNEAIELGCNMVITHHPLIFNPLADFTEDNVRGRLVCKIIRAGINVFSAHTNLDFADGGVNDALAARLNLCDVMTLDGEHRFGTLRPDATLDIEAFAGFADDALDACGVKCIVPPTVDLKKPIRKVGVSCGSFDKETAWIYENNIDVLVTGEIKHSDAIDLSMEKFVTLSCGHYPTEIFGAIALCDNLKSKLQSRGIRICDGACSCAAGENVLRVLMSENGINPFRKI